MRKKIPYIITLVVVIGIIGGVLWFRSQPDEVEGQVVSSGSYMEQLTGIGYVSSDDTRDMSFAMSGKIARINVEEKMHVEAGDILAELDREDYEEALEQAENNLNVAKARYADYSASYRQSAGVVSATRKTQQNQIQQTELSLTQMETTIEQTQVLVEEGIATPQELSNLQEEKEALILRLEGAKAQLAQQLYPAKTEQEYLASIHANEEAYHRVQEEESDYVLKASISGMVGNVNVKEGDVINAGESILSLYDTNNRQIVIDVDETYLTYLTEGKQVDIYPDAYPEESFKGTILGIGPLVDKESGTVRLKIRILDPEQRLLENMTARIVLTLREFDQIPQIDNNYLFNEEDQWYVMTVDTSSTVVKQAVEIYDANRAMVGIKEGIEEGDIVLIPSEVSLGQEIKVVDENGAGL